jgi:hypothetical protein
MKKTLTYLAIGFFSIVLIAYCASDKSNLENEVELSKEIPIYSKIELKINELDSLVRFYSFLGSQEKHLVFIDYTSSARELITESELYQVDSIKELSEQLKIKLIKTQKEYFPQLRKEYLESLKDKLWVDDITVSYSGKGFTQFTLTGAVFAANRNKQEFQSGLQPLLEIYRFKKVFYKWYDYDDGAYYTIDSKNDSDL